MNYAVIMAGGSGTRFWPVSRNQSPKQFLPIANPKPMIVATVDRLAPLFSPDRIFVVGNEGHRELLSRQLNGIPPNQILLEPFGRNTAAAIGLAAIHLSTHDPDSVMVVLPSDHLIGKASEFIGVLDQAIRLAKAEPHALLTIGLKPTRPETGYGYLQLDEDIRIDGFPSAYHVKTFAEKPNYETAVRFFEAGDFTWNSGMFIWRTQAILEAFQRYMPDLYEELMILKSAIRTPDYQDALLGAYSRMPNTSIDYGVMEKADLVLALRADIGWSDVGSWDEVAGLTPIGDDGNAGSSDRIAWQSTGNLVQASKLVALVGVDDLIVIESDDAILICKKGESQKVKNVVDQLKLRNKTSYL